MATKLRLTQEVRLGIVMYGGSSLCIYMNGVSQELLHLVRATAPTKPASESPSEVAPAAELESTEAVYRQLGQILRHRQPPKNEQPEEGDPVLTRFVVDIISGSSAGGINGVFLAKALANEQRLDQLEELWVQEGDLEALINDRRSKLEGVGLRKPPESLLNSQRMYRKLLDAVDEQDEKAAAAESRLVEELDLFVTTTDLRGLSLPIKLYDSVIYEPRYRNVFRLRYRTLPASGEPRNDFIQANNPLVAFVARCTSAFPFAFEPMMLEDIDEVLKGAPRYGRINIDDVGARSPRWAKFFPDYQVAGDDYGARAFSDGGDLDNKPFSYVVDHLAIRRSTVPVSRKLVYVEPDPADPALRPVDEGRPDLVASVLGAVTLPRAETIRDDLGRVRVRNQMAERMAEVTGAVERGLRLGRLPSTAGPRLPYAVYQRLRVQQAADKLGLGIAEMLGYNEESDRSRAIRTLVRAWVETTYADPYDAQAESGDFTTDRFLQGFDLPHLLRRINFVQRRADALICLDDRAADLLEMVGRPAPANEGDAEAFRQALVDAKRDLNEVYVGLRSFWRVLWQDEDLERGVRAVGVTPHQLDAILISASPERALYQVKVGGEGGEGDVIDFSGSRVGDGPNPRSIGQLSFTVSREGVPAPSSRTVLAGQRVGLDAGDVVTIALPLTDRVILDFSSVSAGTSVQPLGTDGQPVGPTVTAPAPSGSLEVLGEGIRQLVMTGPPREMRLRDRVDPIGRAHALIEVAELQAPMTSLARVIADKTTAAFRPAAARVTGSDGSGVRGILDPSGRSGWDQSARAALRFAFDHFDDYDVVLLPLLHTEGGEASHVDVVRISPDDATSLVDPQSGKRKLAGAELFHYGAFLNEDWRRNDIMWGRLDAAERLVTALLPPDNPLRRTLLRQAQLLIVAEELRKRPALGAGLDGVVTPARVLDHLATDFELPPGPGPEYSMRVAGRGVHVVGNILKGLSQGSAALTGAARLLARLGQIVWGVVEISVPGSLWRTVFRYWRHLLTLVAVFLIVAGAFLNQPGAVRLGWWTVAITLGLGLGTSLLGELFRGRRPRRLARLFAVLLVALVLVLTVIGGVRVTHAARDEVCDASWKWVRKATFFTCDTQAK